MLISSDALTSAQSRAGRIWITFGLLGGSMPIRAAHRVHRRL
jgi:hypothetical protein